MADYRVFGPPRSLDGNALVFDRLAEQAKKLERMERRGSSVAPTADLPEVAYHGQEARLLLPTDPGYGVPIVWSFVYHEPHDRWYFIGGPPWQSTDYPNRTSFNTANLSTYVDLDNTGAAGLSFTAPLAGLYEFRFNYHTAPNSGGQARVVMALNGSISNTVAQVGVSSGAVGGVPASGIGASSVSASAVFKLYGSTNNVSCNMAFLRSRFEIVPVYVTT